MQKVCLLLAFDCYEAFDYNGSVIMNRYDCKYNSGNHLFTSTTATYFDSVESYTVSYSDLRNDDKQIEIVNNNCDYMIFPTANIFNIGNYEAMYGYAEFFKKIKIPIYAIGIGAQSSIDYSYDFLSYISEPAREYLKAIYATGGAVTVRGEFTASVCEKLGFKDVHITGCPSLYFNGRDWTVQDTKVPEEQFRPVFNGGAVNSLVKLLCNHNESLFFDQEYYHKYIYNAQTLSKDEIMMLHQNPFLRRMLKDKRVHIIHDLHVWMKTIQNHGANFTYGNRAHGTFISILCNVPAFIDVIDSRTREFAELFGIPNSMEIGFNPQHDDLYELYCSIDYSKFNAKLPSLFDNMASFFEKHGLEHSLGNNTRGKDMLRKLPFQDAAYQHPELFSYVYAKQFESSQLETLKQ